MRQALNPWPQSNPFGALPGNQSTAAYVRANGPRYIALLEYAFPGATWAPLGRDAVQMGDFLDAFYTSIGQPGRVARLNASGNSLTGESQQNYLQFLASAGLKLTDLANQPPFVIMDRSSYNESQGAQVSKLIMAVYDHYSANGGRPVDLVSRVNAISISHTRGANFYLNSKHNIQSYFSNIVADYAEPPQIAALVSAPITKRFGLFQRGGLALQRWFNRLRYNMARTAAGRAVNKGRPREILVIPESLGGALIDTLQWHNTFGNFAWKDGRFEAVPGTPFDSATRQAILATNFEVFQIVSEPSFLEQVKQEARNLGYEFNVERANQNQMVTPETKHKALLKDLEILVSGLGERGEQKKYFSRNAASLSKWLDGALLTTNSSEKKEEILFSFIDAVLQSSREKRIGTRDTRRLIAQVLARASMTDDSFVEKFREAVEKKDELKAVLVDKGWSFVSEATREHEVVSANYNIVLARILGPMGCNALLTKPKDKGNE
jgi:hypothetical protein